MSVPSSMTALTPDVRASVLARTSAVSQEALPFEPFGVHPP